MKLSLKVSRRFDKTAISIAEQLTTSRETRKFVRCLSKNDVGCFKRCSYSSRLSFRTDAWPILAIRYEEKNSAMPLRIVNPSSNPEITSHALYQSFRGTRLLRSKSVFDFTPETGMN